MPIDQVRRWALNLWLGCLVAAGAIDILPGSPPALQSKLSRWLTSLGIQQGAWTLFAPEPDHVNSRLRVEITYRDGRQLVWTSPDWRRETVYRRWLSHRRFEWLDHVVPQGKPPVWEAWCRYLVRTLRSNLDDPVRGAQVRVIHEEAIVPPAEQQPWISWRQPIPVTQSTVLTIEQF
jgi:hypothetical protein